MSKRLKLVSTIIIFTLLLSCNKKEKASDEVVENNQKTEFHKRQFSQKLSENFKIIYSYYENGQLKSISEFVDGCQNGYFIQFYENGQVKRISISKNYDPVGKIIDFKGENYQVTNIQDFLADSLFLNPSYSTSGNLYWSFINNKDLDTSQYCVATKLWVEKKINDNNEMFTYNKSDSSLVIEKSRFLNISLKEIPKVGDTVFFELIDGFFNSKNHIITFGKLSNKGSFLRKDKVIEENKNKFLYQLTKDNFIGDSIVKIEGILRSKVIEFGNKKMSNFFVDLRFEKIWSINK